MRNETNEIELATVASTPERLPTAEAIAALRRQQTARRRANEDQQDRQRERARLADGGI